MTLGKEEFLKYLVLHVKDVNELGFLKECLKGRINFIDIFWKFIHENFVK